MQRQHFRLNFYAANILFACIYMNTGQNIGFLQINCHKK